MKTRPVNARKPITVWLKADLRGRMDLHLFSTSEQKIPFRAHSDFLSERIREYFDWRELRLEAYGFPEGYFVKGPREMIDKLKERLEQ